MIKKLQELGKEISAFHQRLYSELIDLKRQTAKSGDMTTLANVAYFMREIDKHLGELGKEVRKVQNLSEKMACLIHVQLGEVEPIRTDYVTASPTVKITVTLPHHSKHPKEFKELMEFLDVPREHWDCEEPTIQLRYNGVNAAITQAGTEGKPLPKCIDLIKQHPVYTLRMLKKLSITEEPKEVEDAF